MTINDADINSETNHGLEMDRSNRRIASETRREASHAAIKVALLGWLAVVVSLIILAILQNRSDAGHVASVIFCFVVAGPPFAMCIGAGCGMTAYYIFRGSQISLRMMAIALTVLFEFAIAGWIIVLQRNGVEIFF